MTEPRTGPAAGAVAGADPARPLRLGTRRSALATSQSGWVADRLRAAGREVELVLVTTEGDTSRRSLTEIGGTGVFASALRTSAARVVDAEMSRLDHRLPHLPDDERAEVRQTVQRVVDKLLHTPTTRVKQLQAGYDEVPADYASALRELFDLDSREVASVSTPPLGVVDRAQDPRTEGTSDD